MNISKDSPPLLLLYIHVGVESEEFIKTLKSSNICITEGNISNLNHSHLSFNFPFYLTLNIPKEMINISPATT